MTTQVRVRVSATSANLGPGFDTLGLALHNELTLGESDHVMASINGEGAGELAVDGDNLVVRAARGALQRPLRPDGPVQELPPRRGVRLCLLQRVLHHTANAFGRFQDLCRVLRPGGFIVIGLYNTYGRLLLDLRRLLFRISGDRLTWLDYFMRRKTLGDGKKRIWFLDQYRNPHELKFSVHHVLEWFDRCGIDYVNSAPQSSTGMDPLGGSGGGLLYHHRLQKWERDMSRESIKTNWATAKELLLFLWRGKNWWLTPIIVLLLLMSGLIIFLESSAIAPFIYALF